MNTVKTCILTLAAVLLLAHSTHAQNIVYTDAAEFPLYGKVCDDTPHRYNRLPGEFEGQLKETLWNLGKNSAGEYIRFRSDSPTIKFKWENTGNFRMAHMSETGIKGLDLYTLTPQGWRFVHSAVPWSGKKNEYKAIGNMTPQMREYMLYLPLYDGIDSLWIGIEEGYTLDQPAVARPVTEKPIVAYGTSILQGGCVSRPGMVHTSIIERRLDREVINLGFSGSAHLEPQIAEWMCRVEDPGVFVLDYTENTTPAELDSLQEGFFRILRKHHPKVPIVFVEHVHFPYIYLDTKEAESVRTKNAKLRAFYEKMKKEGEKNLFYVPADKMIGDDGEATVDGIHLTDVGMLRYADLVTPYIRKALNKNK